MATVAYRTLIENEFKKSHLRSISTICRFIIADGYSCRASDIHIDPFLEGILIRLRVDGALCNAYQLPIDAHTELVARLKILSRLRIDDHFSAQDGRFSFTLPHSAQSFDVRTSILPTQHGESVVLRLLIPLSVQDSLLDLGFREEQAEIIGEALNRVHGMILIVGPTGSGKTTTLYTFIRKLLRTNRSIISIEDPVEYSVSGVRQAQVQPRHGLTFAEGLRAILRQDPDVIVVGEIRDTETAQLAISAAHTGHLVLSTIHAINAEGAHARLEELGIARSKLRSMRVLLVVQELVGKAQGRTGRSGQFTLSYA